MPQLGESVVEGTVGRWLKQVGDSIQQYEPILEVITDKVNTEIPAPASGTLLQILVPEGTTVQAGTVIAQIGEPGESSAPPAPAGTGSPSVSSAPPAPAPASGAPAASAQTVPAAATGQGGGDGSARNRFTPVVARMIAEYSITPQELAAIHGTGDNGRISKKDIEQFVQQRSAKPSAAAPTAPVPAWEQPGTGELFRPTEEVFGAKERAAEKPAPPAPYAPAMPAAAPAATQAEGELVVPLSPMRRAIAEHMVRSKTLAPHVTTVHEADMSRVLAHWNKRQDEFTRQGVKLTYTPYFIQAIVYGLQQVPLVNAQFSEQGVLMKRDLNIGVAVAVEEGLIVPVVQHADDKSLLGLARAVNDLAARAREKRLTPDQVAGGTFTLTNYGVFGSLFGTPIISQPQSAILGVGAIQKRPVVINDAIAIRPMVYLALSFDHRLLDGAIGDTFMRRVKQFLESYPE